MRITNVLDLSTPASPPLEMTDTGDVYSGPEPSGPLLPYVYSFSSSSKKALMSAAKSKRSSGRARS